MMAEDARRVRYLMLHRLTCALIRHQKRGMTTRGGGGGKKTWDLFVRQ